MIEDAFPIYGLKKDGVAFVWTGDSNQSAVAVFTERWLADLTVMQNVGTSLVQCDTASELIDLLSLSGAQWVVFDPAKGKQNLHALRQELIQELRSLS